MTVNHGLDSATVAGLDHFKSGSMTVETKETQEFGNIPEPYMNVIRPYIFCAFTDAVDGAKNITLA